MPAAARAQGTTWPASYVLPIRRQVPERSAAFAGYLRWLSQRVELIVVDGSPPDVFAAHAAQWGKHARHVPVDADLLTPNGKVGGVLTGVRLARHERLVLADDDVRYDAAALRRALALLDEAHVVRPQNHFDPLPWHARWDTGRMLLNRMLGGDWPGTLVVRRSALQATGGYDGAALFENLELVRTVKAAGGVERCALDVFVRRLPPTTKHFLSQRTRQAYDEFARPLRMVVALCVVPLVAGLALRGQWKTLAVAAGAVAAVAEGGRRRAGGREVFPATSALWAPLWLAERGVHAWLALGLRLSLGGVPYRGSVLRRAATPPAVLRRRQEVRGQRLAPPSPEPQFAASPPG